MPLANPLQHIEGSTFISLANGDLRVLAKGIPANQLTIRTTLVAAAVNIFCK
jgi:hypothetical protein